MLASLADAPLEDAALVYEPKYDGIRAIAEVPAQSGAVRLWSRLGNEKTSQFPEIAEALTEWWRKRKPKDKPASVVLDGEIVALDASGEPTSFQHLQKRIHLTQGERDSAPVAYIVFDLLRAGSSDYCGLPLIERRAALERLFGRTGSGGQLRLSEQVAADGRALYRRAIDRGWEGLVVKQARSLYKPGKRTPDWRKLKITHEQEFVVGGWTDPRSAREHLGALLLGVYRKGSGPGSRELVYVGSVGSGFDERELTRLMRLLKPLATDDCPFLHTPQANARPHWVTPTLVAQVKFTEWTADGKLRHPVYLGLRDDKDPRTVEREDPGRSRAGRHLKQPAVGGSTARRSTRVAPSEHREALEPTEGRSTPEPPAVSEKRVRSIVDQLQSLEDGRRDGALDLGDGESLQVTNLHKVFWPRQKLTKGDLFRYYATVAPVLLPVLADRPLVMKRYPDGVNAKPFYQHGVKDVPAGVALVRVGADRRTQIVGGTLKTLLYTTQLAAISQDPWFSRIQSLESADHVAMDLEPAPGVPFSTVLDVARWIRDELETLGGFGLPKTSGADGLHVYIPLPPGTSYEAGLLYCQIVATLVAHKHPRTATVERSVQKRGRRVYVDCLQNILGKTLAGAYSARASDYAGVSTPLTWDEVDQGVSREDFTISSFPARLLAVGDLWAGLRGSKGVDLSVATRS